MKSISILPLFLIVSLSLVTAQVEKPATKTAKNIIVKACASSTNKSLCLSVLNSEPKANTTNLQGLAFIALKIASDTAVHTRVSIRSMINKGDIDDSKLEEGLSSCADLYVSAVHQMEESLEALVSKNFEEVKDKMKTALTDIEICYDDMQRLSAPEAKDLEEKSRKVHDLCKNALELVNVSSHETN